MGSIKKFRKKYVTPSHPWQENRIKDELELVKNYGLKNKKEIWRASYQLRTYTWQAKKLVGESNDQSIKERDLLLKKLQRYNLLGEGQDIGDILNLQVKDILDRRLQTVAVRKKLALSMKQARQLITHGHIEVNGNKIDAPGHLVSLEEENNLGYISGSPFTNKDHPELNVILKPVDNKERLNESTRKDDNKKDEKTEIKDTKVKGKSKEVKESKVEEKTEKVKESKPEEKVDG